MKVSKTNYFIRQYCYCMQQNINMPKFRDAPIYDAKELIVNVS